MKFDTAGRSL